MVLPNKITAQLRRYGHSHVPIEACGILTRNINSGKVTFHAIKNVSPSEDKWDYVMEPNEYMKVMQTTTLFHPKTASNELLALFHTHPNINSVAIPSIYDKLGAGWKTIYIIYAPLKEQMFGWKWDGKTFIHEYINGIGIKDFEGKNLEYNDNLTNIGWEPWKNIKLPS